MILYIYDTVNELHCDTLECLNDCMDKLPISVHKSNALWDTNTKKLLTDWELPVPLTVPCILMQSEYTFKYIYPEFYDDSLQMMGDILDFYEVNWNGS